VVDGNWRSAGVGKFPVSHEGVVFSRIRGSRKAAQIPEEGNGSLERQRERERPRDRRGLGEQGQHQKCIQSESWHQNVMKNATHKESS